MICDDVRPLIEAGSISDPQVLDHLEGCDACAAAAEERGLLEVSVRSTRAADDRGVRELLLQTEARISMDRTAAGWMKSRPTWLRRSIAAASALSIFLFGVLLVRRPDFDAYPKGRMVLTIAVIATLLIASLMLGLRPLHRPRLPTWSHRMLTTVAVLVAFLLAAVPAGYVTPEELTSTKLIHLLGMPCFFLGVFLGVPVYAVARLLDRGSNPFSAVLAALAAGLTGNLVLHVHCPRSDAIHLLAGHFTVVLVFVFAGAALVWIEARFGRKNVLKGSNTFESR